MCFGSSTSRRSSATPTSSRSSAKATYREILNTDGPSYGGSGVGNLGTVQTNEDDSGHATLRIAVPPLAAIAFDVPTKPTD